MEAREMSEILTLYEDKPDQEETYAGVDWLTVTAKEHDARHMLWYATERLKGVFMRAGEEVLPWKFKGYAGFKIGSMRWGSREDSDIGILSGTDAYEHWFRFGVAAENCTRIDLAVTTTLSERWKGLAKGYYEWHARGNARPDVPNLGFTLIQNTHGGETVYVGSRTSRQFGRIYDKGAEQKKEELTGYQWRYEVEYKKPLAGPVLKALLSMVRDGDLPGAMRSSVHNWFAERDCPPIFEGAGPMLELETEARVTSDEVKLWWLSSQVCPSVQKLVDRGRLDDVVKALGLWERVQLGNGEENGTESLGR